MFVWCCRNLCHDKTNAECFFLTVFVNREWVKKTHGMEMLVQKLNRSERFAREFCFNFRDWNVQFWKFSLFIGNNNSCKHLVPINATNYQKNQMIGKRRRKTAKKKQRRPMSRSISFQKNMNPLMRVKWWFFPVFHLQTMTLFSILLSVLSPSTILWMRMCTCTQTGFHLTKSNESAVVVSPSCKIL